MDYFNNVIDPAVSIESALAASSAGLPSGGIPPFGEIEPTRWGIGVNTLIFTTAPNNSFVDTITNNSVGQNLPPSTTYTGGNFSNPTTFGGTTFNQTIDNPTLSGGTGSGVTFYNPTISGGTGSGITLYNPTFYNPITVSGGSGLVNPMTTLGDMIVGGASGTPLRLAAPLVGSGNGYGLFSLNNNSQFPSWARSIAAGDFVGNSGDLYAICFQQTLTFNGGWALVTLIPPTTGLPSGKTIRPVWAHMYVDWGSNSSTPGWGPFAMARGTAVSNMWWIYNTLSGNLTPNILMIGPVF